MLQKCSFINKFYCKWKCKLSLRGFSIRPDYCTYSGPCEQTRSRPASCSILYQLQELKLNFMEFKARKNFCSIYFDC